MIVYEYNLDMVPGPAQGRTIVSLSQYDDNFYIYFHLFTRNGSFAIESGTTARIRGTKPDGNGFSATATVDASDMTVLVEGDKQMTAAAGTSQYELTLMKGTKELNTANFDVYIERAALDIDTPSSETKLRELYDYPVDDIFQATTTAINARDDAISAKNAAVAAKDDAIIAKNAAIAAVDGLEELVQRNFIYETVSGSVASFTDGGDGLPVKRMEAEIDPVQDLHGYTKPWAGGAGKNLLPMTVDIIKADNGGASSWNGNSKTISGITFTINTDSAGNVTGIKANGTNTGSNIILNISTFAAPANSILSGSGDSTLSKYYIYARGGGTVCRNGDVAISNNDINVNRQYAIAILENASVSNVVFYPMIRLASDSATFEPYSNICPITGHTSAAITRAGKNLLPMTVDGIKAANGGASSWNEKSKTINGVTFTLTSNSAGSVTGIQASGTASASTWLILGTINDLPAGDYTINGTPPTGTSSTYYLALTDSSIGFVPEYGSGVNIVKSASDTGRIGINIRANYNANNLVFLPMIRLRSDADATFVPYRGQVYNITFPSEAGTVYGGTLDLNAGRLTVDKANIASYSGQSINAPWLSSMDEYAEGRTPTAGAQVVYPLTTPITHNLTAEEITTLLGINHIWADTGDVSVEYAADPKLYINKVIANALNA